MHSHKCPRSHSPRTKVMVHSLNDLQHSHTLCSHPSHPTKLVRTMCVQPENLSNILEVPIYDRRAHSELQRASIMERGYPVRCTKYQSVVNRTETYLNGYHLLAHLSSSLLFIIVRFAWLLRPVLTARKSPNGFP